MGTEIKYTLKGKRLTCSGRECPSYQKVEGHQIWKCVAPHGFTTIGRKVGSTCHPGERQRLDRLEAENVSLRKDNAQLRRIETRTKVLRNRVTSMEAEIKEAKEIAFGAVPGRPESGSMMQNTLLEQIAVLVRGFEARVDRWSVRAGAAELERDRLLAQARKDDDPYPPELLGDMVHTCPKCGHDDVATHSSVPHLKAEIARLQGMITGPTGPNDGPIGRCGYTGEVGNPDSARAVGCRDIDICDEVKRLKAEIAHLTEDRQFAVDDAIRKTGEILLLKEEAEKNQATFRALSGPILPELLVGIATGRVHLALQAQITMQPRPEPKDFEERVLRAGKALWDAGVTVNMADPSSFEEAKEQFCKVARYVLEEAAPKANTCAPSKEGLLDKEVEDHG